MLLGVNEYYDLINFQVKILILKSSPWNETNNFHDH